MNLDQRTRLFGRVERATEVPMLVLSVAFLVTIALPEFVELSETAYIGVEGAAWTIWALFAFELVVKTYLAPDRKRYLITHWADIVTVLVPFLRSVRLLQVLVIGARSWTEARTVLKHRTFSFLGVTSLLAVSLGAALVYLVEKGGDGPIQTFGDALWWSVVTITTVGYGDLYPKTPAGRGIAVLIMLSGISLFGLLTARVAAFFVEGEERNRDESKLDEILARLERIEQQNRDRTEQVP